jgi:hypothetical protein
MSAIYKTPETYYNTPLFSVTPAKKCCEGNYLLSMAEREECNKMTFKECTSNCCGKGYVGRPILFEYSTMSDHNWSNQIPCDCSHGVRGFKA